MRFAYTGIEVKNMDESIRFYTEMLGMELLDRHPIPQSGGEVAALKSKDSEQLLELNFYPDSRYDVGSELDHLAFEVGDVQGEMQRLQSQGAIMARSLEVRSRYIVGFMKDPNGIWIELFQVRK